jgi:uncharacterized protein
MQATTSLPLGATAPACQARAGQTLLTQRHGKHAERRMLPGIESCIFEIIIHPQTLSHATRQPRLQRRCCSSGLCAQLLQHVWEHQVKTGNHSSSATGKTSACVFEGWYRSDHHAIAKCPFLMQLTLAGRSQNFIHSYDDHSVTIGEKTIVASSLISPGALGTWPVSTVAELTPAQLQPIFALKPEVVILATGTKQQFPAAAVRAAFMAREIGLEVMALGPACRTFNVLLSEDRHVVMALVLPAR